MNARSTIVTPISAAHFAEARVARYDWATLAEELSGYGCALLEKLLSREECEQIAGLYPHEAHFRSRVIMARHGFAIMPRFSSSATVKARPGQRRCCCNTVPATSIACTRIFTAISPFRSRWRSSSRNREGISPAASLS